MSPDLGQHQNEAWLFSHQASAGRQVVTPACYHSFSVVLFTYAVSQNWPGSWL